MLCAAGRCALSSLVRPFDQKLATGSAFPRFSLAVVQNVVWGVLYDVRVLAPYYFLRTSPFTGYLLLSRHFIFIITLFISIITQPLLRI